MEEKALASAVKSLAQIEVNIKTGVGGGGAVVIRYCGQIEVNKKRGLGLRGWWCWRSRRIRSRSINSRRSRRSRTSRHKRR